MARTDLLARADSLRTGRTPFVLATVVRAERPTSAKPGDRALVMPDGTIEGFVGGVCAEATVRMQGLQLLETGASTLLRITPSPEDVEDIEGLVTVNNPCLSGGTLDIFLEAMLPPTLVHVHGIGPIARALLEVGRSLGYQVVDSPSLDEPMPDDLSAVVVASHGRDEELPVTAALRAGVPYVGLLASRKRGATVLALVDATDEAKARVHTPAGLDIGARTPAEIALSVYAEIIQSRPREIAPPPEDVTPAHAQARSNVAATEPVTAHTSAPSASASNGAGATAGSGSGLRLPVIESAVDPVCGMSVAKVESSLQLVHDGETYYFCNPGCRRKFAENPGAFL